jgi:methionyl-tRNA formyltransferase
MNVIYLTTDDPLYLPAFFDRVLREGTARTLAVYVVPPLYKRQTPLDATLRYARTFGLRDAARLAAHVLAAKLKRRSVASICARWGVRYEEVPDVNAPAFLERLRREAPDVLVSVSCPQIFRKPLIELPPKGILNIHGAILPQYRGVLPSFWMMANGEKQAGVSIYFVSGEKIDVGDRCGLEIFDIREDDTLDSFLARSKGIAAELLLEVLKQVERGTAAREPVDLADGSYYSWPDIGAVKRFREAGRKVW